MENHIHGQVIENIYIILRTERLVYPKKCNFILTVRRDTTTGMRSLNYAVMSFSVAHEKFSQP
jgi:hypothetical protein